MFGAGVLARHAWLVDGMSRAVGADLAAAAEGRIGGARHEAVRRCLGCAAPEACAAWLAGHGEGAAAAPGYCRNAALFAALAPSGAAPGASSATRCGISG